VRSKSLDLRIGWCLANVVLLLVPVLIPVVFWSSVPGFVPGFLSYCYALLAVSLYLFDQYLKITDQKITYVNTKKWLSIIVMFGIMAFYVWYNPDKVSLKTPIISILSATIFIIVFLLAYQLNIPLLKRQEADEERKEREIDEMVKKTQETSVSTRREAQAIVKGELNEDR